MGVYSTEAAQLYKESQVEFNPNAAGLLEFAVETQRADQSMFDTMLEMDFLEYHCESGLCVITEEEKTAGIGNALKSIGQKIVAAIEKLMQTIQLALQKLANFVAKMAKVDAGLIKKYGKDLDLAKAKANAGDKKIVIVDYEAAGQKIATFVNGRKAQYDAVVGTGSLDDVNGKVDGLKSEVAALTKLEDFVTEKKLSEIDSAAGFVSVVDGGYDKLAETVVAKDAKEFLKVLKKARTDAQKNLVATIGKKDVDRAALSDKFKYVSALNSAVAKIINFGANVTAKAMAESRKAYVAIAVAANKKEKAAKEEATKESASYEEMLEFAFEVATDNAYDEFTLA